MSIIKISKLLHKFIDKDEEGNVVDEKIALNEVDLGVEEGQFIAILGHNGSGKSTLAKHINAILMPTDGTVMVADMDTTDEENLWDIRQNAGMVFQNPDNQIIATVVEEDVGFGPENLGVPTSQIWERVNKALTAVDMNEYRKHSPAKLSGGQKQRVAIAGVVAMCPKCIILDEPTAMLDPTGRKEVIETIKELNKKDGVTIILVTHYMNEVIDADRVFVMDRGNVAMSGTPVEIFSQVDELKQLGLDVPQVTQTAYYIEKLGVELPVGIVRVDELVQELEKICCDDICKKTDVSPDSMRCESVYTEMIEGISADMDVENISIETKDIDSSIDGEETENSVGNLEKNANKIIRVEHIEYIYQPGTSYEKKAVDDVSLDIYEGELLGIIGHTGSGKSTLIQHLNGLIKPTSGKVYFQDEDIYDGNHSMADLRKNVGLVFQYPEYQLFENTVLEDVCFGPLNLGCTKEEAIDRAKLAMKMVGVKESMYERSPFELSGGEKRRVAIAGVLAMEPKVLILDEPTAGLDPKGRDEILGMLKELQKTRDITVVLVSHSMEDMAKYADRIIVMNHAKLMYEGTPQTVFRKYKELEKMGLAAPQVTYIIEKLKQSGIDISGEALSSKEAARLIVEAI